MPGDREVAPAQTMRRAAGLAREAVAALRDAVSHDPHRSLTREGGLPTGHQSQALIASTEVPLAA
jgi:hypothetical protein